MRLTYLTTIIILTYGCVSLQAEDTPSKNQKLAEKYRRIGFENISGGTEGREKWKAEKDRASPGFICVNSSGTVWIYKHPPHTGSGHGDGIAPFTFLGRVFDSEGKPVKDCAIIEMPSRQFGGVSRETEVGTTDSNGKFSIKTSVGAAITSSGEYAGDIYQSRLKTFVFRTNGLGEMRITLGYDCPELLVFMKSANKTLQGTENRP